MLRAYIKYLAIYLVIEWLLLMVQIYIVMEPIPIYPKYYAIPLALAAILALFPAYLEKRIKEKEEEFDRLKIRENAQSKRKVPVNHIKKDALTGALSKDAFNEIIGIKIMEAKHVGQPLSMVIFDIDFFKKINDNHGHIVGDKVLKEIAEVVHQNIRTSEYFVRWGGEEFIILLPGTDIHGAKMVAEKIRRVVENNEFSDVGRVTCSFGVTQLLKDDTITSFIERADEALYEAKRGGRNQVRTKL